MQVLNELAFASEDVARRILTQKAEPSGSGLLADLMKTIQHPEPVVQCSAMLALSTLAFPRANKLQILQADGCLTLLKSLASKKPETEDCDTSVSFRILFSPNLEFPCLLFGYQPVRGHLLDSAVQQLESRHMTHINAAQVRMAALRVLSVLGQNDLVDAANGKPPIRGRGLRVLALDGGGMKGMTEVTLLREIEKRTGKRMHELFDVSCHPLLPALPCSRRFCTTMCFGVSELRLQEYSGS